MRCFHEPKKRAMPWLKTRPVEGRGSSLFPPRCCSRRRCGGPRPREVAAALSELRERCDARLGSSSAVVELAAREIQLVGLARPD